MGKVVIQNDISSFLSKVRRTKTKQYANDIANMIAKDGEEIAKKKYGISTEAEVDGVSPTITVTKEDANNGKAQIVASGKGLFYLEYGTGVKGERSHYKGDLNFPIEFNSSYGVKVNLNKWTYYYAYQHRPQLSPHKFQGHKAYAQMFNTARELRKKYGSKR